MEITDAEIEAVRSALHGLFVELDIGDFAAKSWARAAILAYLAALRAQGYKVLARKPTTADPLSAAAWRAMWDAAPEEPT